jgi:transcriptional regulator with XRE-family HTH domain
LSAADSQAWRRMQKSLKSPEYKRLIAMLVAMRKKAEVRQQVLAKKLGKPQSFVAKYEGDERRIDLVEFIAIVRALEGDPVRLFREFLASEPQAKSTRKSPTK